MQALHKVSHIFSRVAALRSSQIFLRLATHGTLWTVIPASINIDKHSPSFTLYLHIAKLLGQFLFRRHLCRQEHSQKTENALPEAGAGQKAENQASHLKERLSQTLHPFDLDPLGFTWIDLDSLGLTWIHLDSRGFTWPHLDSLGLTWSHLIHLDSLALTWIHLDSLGLTWTH